MLMETTDKAFKIGDLVRIKSTGQVGTIVAFENNQWKVEVPGAMLLKEASDIERRQALFG